MQSKRFRTAFCLATLMALPTQVIAQSAGNLQSGYAAMLDVESSLPLEADPVPPIKHAFAQYFGHVAVTGIDKLSNEDLGAYFSAAHILAFFSKAPDDLGLMEAAFHGLESRGLLSPFDVRTMHGEYVRYRLFARATALASRHPDLDLEPLPPFSGLDGEFHGPTVLDLGEDGSVSRVAAELPGRGPYVVVAAHPLCHFSENAVRAIQQDSALAGLFAGRTLWLMPQDGHLDLDVVRDWNRQFPDYTMRWAWRTSDWPMIKRWATPNFYFYRDGKLVDTVIGWPPEGQRAALLGAFRKIGLAPPEAP